MAIERTKARVERAVKAVLRGAHGQPGASDASWWFDLHLLSELARAGHLNAAHFDAIYDALPKRSNVREQLTKFSWLLMTRGNIPGNTGFAQRYLDPSSNDQRYDLLSFGFLAQSADRLAAVERKRMSEIALSAVTDRPVIENSTLRLAAMAGAAGLLTSEDLEGLWYEDKSLDISFPWDLPPDTIRFPLEAGVVEWDVVTDLARAAANLSAPRDAKEFFQQVANDYAFAQPDGLDDIYLALARNVTDQKTSRLASDVLARLGRVKYDARKLMTETGISAAQVWSAPKIQQPEITLSLQRAWRDEREPQVKIAIAMIILNSYTPEFSFSDHARSTLGLSGQPFRHGAFTQ